MLTARTQILLLAATAMAFGAVAPATNWVARSFVLVVFAALGVFAFFQKKPEQPDPARAKLLHQLAGLFSVLWMAGGTFLLIASFTSPLLSRARLFALVLIVASLFWMVVFCLGRRWQREPDAEKEPGPTKDITERASG